MITFNATEVFVEQDQHDRLREHLKKTISAFSRARAMGHGDRFLDRAEDGLKSADIIPLAQEYIAS